MTYLLYRPHIHVSDIITTSDYLISGSRIFLADANPIALPIDLVRCSVEMALSHDVALIAPSVFVFAGDEAFYAAPALALLDSEIHAQDARLAWRLARISVARVALFLLPGTSLTLGCGEGTAHHLASDRLVGAARQIAAIYPASELRRIAMPSVLHITLAADRGLEHSVKLVSISEDEFA